MNTSRSNHAFLTAVGIFLLSFFGGPISWAASSVTDSEVRQLLDEFLAGASVNDAAMHERFWHPDLIYTSSAGQRFGKADIMQGMTAEDSGEGVATPRYWAEEVHVRELGDMVIVTFRLMAETPDPSTGGTSQQQYFNTGVLVKTGGQWQAITWQATRAAE